MFAIASGCWKIVNSIDDTLQQNKNSLIIFQLDSRGFDFIWMRRNVNIAEMQRLVQKKKIKMPYDNANQQINEKLEHRLVYINDVFIRPR